jgi:hypothetical protein
VEQCGTDNDEDTSLDEYWAGLAIEEEVYKQSPHKRNANFPSFPGFAHY